MEQVEISKSEIFQFSSFKIDELNLKAQNNTTLLNKKYDQNDDFYFQLGFFPPIFIEENNQYIVRLAAKVVDSEELLEANGIITGLFEVKERLTQENERNFIISHAPTILLPYLRSAFTNIFASSGYGCIILPLINLTKIARSASDSEVKIITPKK